MVWLIVVLGTFGIYGRAASFSKVLVIFSVYRYHQITRAFKSDKKQLAFVRASQF
jgi:hypothetical protein